MGDGILGGGEKKVKYANGAKNKEMRRNGREYSKPHHCPYPSQFLLPPTLNVAPLPVSLQLLCCHLSSPPSPTPS